MFSTVGSTPSTLRGMIFPLFILTIPKEAYPIAFLFSITFVTSAPMEGACMALGVTSTFPMTVFWNTS